MPEALSQFVQRVRGYVRQSVVAGEVVLLAPVRLPFLIRLIQIQVVLRIVQYL